MRNTGKYTVISIESQKGGVGKTTVAFNLAEMCRQQENTEVLLMDLDISGTSAALAAESPVFADSSTPVSFPIDDEGGKTSNIVDAFASYMRGGDAPRVCWVAGAQNASDTGQVVLKRGKTNVISSEFGDDQTKTLPYGPSVLFDEVHVGWFMDLIKSLVWNASLGLDDGVHLVIILDNAPGYTGLRPAVEEWLTDLGPVTGKFLFVSSLDLQDVTACVSAMERVAGLQKAKRDASCYYSDLAGDGDLEPKRFRNDKAGATFFSRLASSCPEDPGCCSFPAPASRATCTECSLCWHRATAVANTTPICGWLDIRFNKIPPSIFGEDAKVDWIKALPEACRAKWQESFERARLKGIEFDPEYALLFACQIVSQGAAERQMPVSPQRLRRVEAPPNFHVGLFERNCARLQKLKNYAGAAVSYVHDLEEKWVEAVSALEFPNQGSNLAFRMEWWQQSPSVRFLSMLRGVPEALLPPRRKRPLGDVAESLRYSAEWCELLHPAFAEWIAESAAEIGARGACRIPHLADDLVGTYAAALALRSAQSKGIKPSQDQQRSSLSRLKRIFAMVERLPSDTPHDVSALWQYVLAHPDAVKAVEKSIFSDPGRLGEMRLRSDHCTLELESFARSQLVLWKGGDDFVLLDTALDIYCELKHTELSQIVFKHVFQAGLTDRSIGFNDVTRVLELLRPDAEGKARDPLTAIKTMTAMKAFRMALSPVIKAFRLGGVS